MLSDPRIISGEREDMLEENKKLKLAVACLRAELHQLRTGELATPAMITNLLTAPAGGVVLSGQPEVRPVVAGATGFPPTTSQPAGSLVGDAPRAADTSIQDDAQRSKGEPSPGQGRGASPQSPTWPYVLAFARMMEAKLEKNRHKGNREGWIADAPELLLKRLREETSELATEIAIRARTTMSIEDIGGEAADVGNFAMMIADVCGALKPEAESDTFYRGWWAARERYPESGAPEPRYSEWDRALATVVNWAATSTAIDVQSFRPVLVFISSLIRDQNAGEALVQDLSVGLSEAEWEALAARIDHAVKSADRVGGAA